MKRTSTTALLTSVLFTTSQSSHSNRRVVRKMAASSSPSSSIMSSSASLPAHHEPSKSSSTLFGCGTSLSSAIVNLSPNSLCPSGLDSDCPDNTYCYAGLVAADETMHRQLFERQADMEREIVNAAIEEREEGQSQSSEDDKFVCGVSWEQAVESVCLHHTSPSSTTTAAATSRQEPIYCSTGGDSACPSNMACYASVSCSSTSTSTTATSRVDSDPLHSTREVPIYAKHYEMVQNLSIASSQENDDAAVTSWYSSLLDSSGRLGWNGLLSFGSL